MTAWILVIAYHAGGSVTMLPGGYYSTLEACLAKGREIQATKASAGFTASSVCLETGRKL